jgi:hypothetical protein
MFALSSLLTITKE